jgi:hypothetical protein
MLEAIVGVAVGVSILPVYEHLVKPYVMLKNSGVSFFNANKKNASDLGHAVAEWDDSYRFMNWGREEVTKQRDRLPKEIKGNLAESLNTSRMHETAASIVERYRIKKAEGYRYLDMYLKKLARKQMIKSFYQEPAVLAYLTSS